MDPNVKSVVTKNIKNLPPHLLPVAEFLLDSAKLLNWGDLSKDIVMDIGCGVNTLKIFRNVFPNFHKIIALDINPNCINYMNFYQCHPRIEYCVADITRRQTIDKWQGQMSRIISTFCINRLNDQKSAFENMYHILKPGGEAIILSGMRNPHYECAKNLLSKPKWKMFQHLENKFPERHCQGTGIAFYERILKDIDFEIIFCREDMKWMSFPSEEDFRASELTEDKVILPTLPESLKAEFKEEYCQTLMELNGHSPSGQLCLKTSTVRIIIRRK